MRRMAWLVVASLAACASGSAHATDIPVTGLKLIVVDKTSNLGLPGPNQLTGKMVFVAKDLNITKGMGTDPTQIEAALGVAYDGVSGTFDMPQGPNWLVNSASVGKYVHKTAPTDGAVKVSVIKAASLVKVVGKGLGDGGARLGVSGLPLIGPVYVADTIVNGGDTTRLCTQFSGCVQKAIANETGYKLTCKRNSTGDAACTAAVTVPSAHFVDQGLTVLDNRTGLAWEKKTTAVGSGVNVADLHDVDNLYTWAGRCSVATAKYCQPNLAAETACKAQTAPAYWGNGCEQCVGGEGACVIDPDFGNEATTTVWDWLSQVNAANYAGHSDWRLPSEDGRNTSKVTDPRELETILLAAWPECTTGPCIYPVFGSTGSDSYWSSSTEASDPFLNWYVGFGGYGQVDTFYKAAGGFYVRAVRDGS
jgi:hypothetical protein